MYNQDQVMEFVNLYLDKYEMTKFPSVRLASVSVFSVADIEIALEQLTDRVKVEEYLSCSRCNTDLPENNKLSIMTNGMTMCMCGNYINPEIDKKQRYIKLA